MSGVYFMGGSEYFVDEENDDAKVARSWVLRARRLLKEAKRIAPQVGKQLDKVIDGTETLLSDLDELKGSLRGERAHRGD